MHLTSESELPCAPLLSHSFFFIHLLIITTLVTKQSKTWHPSDIHCIASQFHPGPNEEDQQTIIKNSTNSWVCWTNNSCYSCFWLCSPPVFRVTGPVCKLPNVKISCQGSTWIWFMYYHRIIQIFSAFMVPKPATTPEEVDLDHKTDNFQDILGNVNVKDSLISGFPCILIN